MWAGLWRSSPVAEPSEWSRHVSQGRDHGVHTSLPPRLREGEEEGGSRFSTDMSTARIFLWSDAQRPCAAL